MRVPVYQQQVTPQIPSVRTQVQVPDGATGVALKPVDTSAGLAQGVESLRLGIMKLQENKEQFELAQSVTEFRRRNTEFLNAKDTGIFAQQGENVFGSTERYTKFATDLAEELAKNRKWSGPARQRFMSAIDNVVNYSTQSVMRFEQDASEKVKNAVFEGTIAQAYQDASMNVRNEELFRDALDTAVSASVERWAPFGKEKVAAETKKLESQFYSLRIASILQDDPRAAQAMFEKNRNALLPDMQVRLDASIKNKMELIETQEMGDQLIRRFGSNEAAGLAFIRKNFEGEEERRYVAEFKTRSSELRSRIAQGRAALGQAQSGFLKELKGRMDQGEKFTPAQLNAFAKEGKMSADGVPKALAYQEALRTRPHIVDRLAKEMGTRGENFYTLPPKEQEDRINAEAWGMANGTKNGWKESRDKFVNDLTNALKFGQTGEDTVKLAVKRGLISNQTGDDIIEKKKRYSQAQVIVTKQNRTALEGLLKKWGLDKTSIDLRLYDFDKVVENIDRKSTDFDDRVHKAREKIAAGAAETYEVSFTGLWGKTKAGNDFDTFSALRFVSDPPDEQKIQANLEKKYKETSKEVTQNAGKK